MRNPKANPDTGKGEAPRPAPPAKRKAKKRANMHDGIGVWADCCSCEAEPRWAALAEEMGIDLDDYEDEDAPKKG